MVLALLFLLPEGVLAQVISNSGAAVTLTGGVIVESGDIDNNNGSVENEGVLNLKGSLFNDVPGIVSGNGYYNLQGSWINNGIYNPDTSTVRFHNGTANHVITHGSVGETFYKLSLNTPGRLVTHNSNPGGVLTVIDSLNIFAGTLNNSNPGGVLTVIDSLNIFAGTLNLGTTTDSLAVRGNANINDELRFNENTEQTTEITKNLSGSGIINMSGENLAHFLNLKGPLNFIQNLTTSPTSFSTVDYRGTNQQVFASPNYRNLTISNTGVKTLQGNSVVGADLDVAGGTFDLGTVSDQLDVMRNANIDDTLLFSGSKIKTLNVGGNLSGGGEIDMSGDNLAHLMNLYGVNNSIGAYNGGSNATVDYTGNLDQNVFTSSTYRNLQVSGSNTKILNADITASGILTMKNGNINSNGNILKLTNDDLAAVIRQAGSVIGKIQRKVTVLGGNYLYPVGTASTYNPLKIKFQDLTQGGSLTAQFKPEAIDTIGLPLDDGDVEIWNRFSEGYWNVNSVPPMASNNYNVNLTYDGFPLSSGGLLPLLVGVDSSSRILKRTDNGPLTLDGNNGFLDSESIGRDEMDGISDVSTDFAIGKGRPKIDTQPEDTSICEGTDAFFDIKVRLHGFKYYKYQWQVNTGAGWTNVTNTGVYSGAQSRTLELTAAPYEMNGYRYRVIVTDRGGNFTISRISLLTVNKIPIATVSIPYQVVCDSVASIDVVLGTANGVTGTTFAWERDTPPGIVSTSDINGSGFIGSTISGTFVNITDNPITVTYTVTPTGPATTYCVGDIVQFVLIIQPTPRIFPLVLNTIQCDSSVTSIQLRSPSTFTSDTVTNAPRLVTFKFTATATGGVTGFTASAANLPNNFVIEDNLINPTISKQTVTYTLVPVSPYGCNDGPSQTFTVIVNPTPRLTALLDGHYVVCDTAQITINLTTGNGAVEGEKRYYLETSYTGDVSNVQESRDYSINDVITNVLVNNTRDLQTVTYRIKPYFENYYGESLPLFDCDRGIDTTITITLNPTPLFDYVNVSDTVICNETTISFEFDNTQITTGTIVYELIGTYVDTAVTGVKPDARYNLDPFTDFLTNSSDSIQPIVYLFQPIIMDTVNNLYCNKGITESRIVKVAPTLRSPAYPFVYIGGKNIRCFGENTGSIDIQPEGGYYLQDYIYSWTKNGVPFGTSELEDPQGLSIGFYEYSVTDIIGCFTSDTLTLTEPEILSVSDSVVGQSCEGIEDGALYMFIEGGTPAYSYNWTSPVTVPKSNIITNLSYGDYVLHTTDINGCKVDSRDIELVRPTPMTLSIQLKKYGKYDVSCFNDANGQIEVFAFANGSPLNYDYIWTTNMGNKVDPQDKAKISGLTRKFEGDIIEYSLTLIDSLGCFGYADTVLVEPDPITVNRTGEYPSGFDITCYDRSDGIIDLELAGGHTEYLNVHYDWEMAEDPGFSESSKNIDSLRAGNYMVSIVDSFGCKAEASWLLEEPDEIILTLDSITDYNGFQVSCINFDNSLIDISLDGGFGNYNYDWSSLDGVVSDTLAEDQSGLPAGNYHLDVLDIKNGIKCPANWDFVITEPDSIAVDPIIALKNGFEISCFNGADGSIILNTFGGVTSVSDYVYTWSTGNGSGLNPALEDQNGLSMGTYNVSVKDNNNCIADWEFTLTEPEKLITKIDTITISCFDNNDGAADLTVTGGVEPYAYLWSNGQISQDIDSLFIGDYSVVVTDANNCVIEDAAVVTEPADIVIELSVPLQYMGGRMISCFGESDAIINSAVTGGKMEGVYNYLWSWNSQTNTSIINVPAGMYTLTITDVNKCTKTDSIFVEQPLELKADIFPDNPTCFGVADGQITLIVQGGTPDITGYSIVWDNGKLGQTADSIGHGRHDVYISDMNNCFIDTFGILEQPEIMQMTKIVNQPTCPDIPNGSIQYTISGGTAPYELLLNDIQVDELISDIGEDRSPYFLVVTDNNQCQLFDTTYLKGQHPTCITIPNAMTPNGDGVNDTWIIDDIEIYPEAKVEVYNRWGELIFYAPKGYTNPWDGSFKGRQLPIDSYYYVIDLNNGKDVITGNITIIR